MGSTNKTTNYELSQFVGTDKPSWLSDYNNDMSKIDTAIKARSVEAGAAQTTADTANGKADALDTRMGTAENNITALQNASTTDHTQIATNTANISKNAQDIVQLDAKIGHTQITIGDHTVTGALAELAQSQGSGDAEDISYDNTTSGLTATNVQAAIDEVKADIPDDATDIGYSNTQSGLSATTVQAAIDEVSKAEGIKYNNTTSGLTATNVQAAVDELAVAPPAGIKIGSSTATFTDSVGTIQNAVSNTRETARSALVTYYGNGISAPISGYGSVAANSKDMTVYAYNMTGGAIYSGTAYVVYVVED